MIASRFAGLRSTLDAGVCAPLALATACGTGPQITRGGGIFDFSRTVPVSEITCPSCIMCWRISRMLANARLADDSNIATRLSWDVRGRLQTSFDKFG